MTGARAKLLLGLLCLWGLCPAGLAADGLPYIIKTTPSLAYIDAGNEAGVIEGDWYIALRQGPDGQPYGEVGHLRVVRVYERFCIAEILATAAGERVAPMQRAVSLEVWRALADMPEEGPAPMMDVPRMGGGEEAQGRASAARGPSRTLYLLAGLDLDKASRPVWAADTLVGARTSNEPSLGVRVAFEGGGAWRLGMSARLAGRPLGGEDGDVSQLGLEVDLHYLLGRGIWAPYVGGGLGWHLLDWESPGRRQGEANKIGVQALAGLETRSAGWRVGVEGGYQLLAEHRGILGGGNWRVQAAVGRDF